jgi:nucleoside-diphosphate kinase
MAISLTEAAAKRVRSFLDTRGQGIALRIGIKKTGCSGFAYVVNYAEKIGQQDVVFEDRGVKVVVDSESLKYIDGTVVDFVKQGLNEAFRFANPNIKGECGCGESFTVYGVSAHTPENPFCDTDFRTPHALRRGLSAGTLARPNAGSPADKGELFQVLAGCTGEFSWPDPLVCEVEMALERTLSIVKPDGVQKNLIGEVYRRFEQAGLRVVAARMLQLSQSQAEGFYAVHRERPFYRDLVRYMTSGPVMVQVLEGENAVARNRDIMGATDPKKAAPGTIRADLAASIEQNVVHGSDAPDTAAREIAFFFADSDLCPRC